jgi:hypothetical protein
MRFLFMEDSSADFSDLNAGGNSLCACQIMRSALVEVQSFLWRVANCLGELYRIHIVV